MANPIIKIKRGTTPPSATLNAGEFAIDQVAKNLYLGIEEAGVVSNVIVGGEGTFATKVYTDAADNALDLRLDDVESKTQNIDPSTSAGNTVVNGQFFLKGDGINNAFAINISGEVSVGAPGRDIYLDRPTYVTGDLSVTGNISATGTVGGTNISDLEAKAQNINLAGTSPGVTKIDGGLELLDTAATTKIHGPLELSYGITSNVGKIWAMDTIDMSLSMSGMLTGLATPVNDTDAARKKYVDDEISKLGTVFHYVGILGSELSDTTLVNGAFDLTKLSDQSPGSYYTNKNVAGLPTMVDQAFSDGVVVFNLKDGDSILKTATSWEKLDHVDAVVIPLDNDNEVSVSGNEQIGYTVGLAPAFKTRVSDVETKTQNIDLAGTTPNTTKTLGSIVVVSNSGDNAVGDVGTVVSHSGFNAYASAGDNYFSVDYTNGIVLGPQYNSWSVQVRNKLEGVEKNGSLPTIENFVIDGGVY